MSKFEAIGPFWVRQSVLSATDELPQGYDLVFAVLSWESRCLASIPYLKGHGKKVVVVHFVSNNEQLEKKKQDNLKQMKLELGDEFEKVLEVNSSLDHTRNFHKLYGRIEEETVRCKRPISILFDMTCLAKRYLLYFLGLCFQSEFALSLDYLYAEGTYSKPSEVEGIEEFRNLVSQGNWELIQVPFFESREYTVDSDHDLYISVGLEMQAVMEYVERNEPRNIRLFDIVGGKARVENALYQTARPKVDSLLTLPNATSVGFELNDVVGLASDILSQGDRKATCLAIGSKPHALAMGLAALSNRQIEVTCRVPVGYHGHDIPAHGPIHRFEIKDRFNPASYRK